MADVLRRHERCSDQPVRGEVGQPLGVGHVALASRQGPHVGGLDQDPLQLLGQQVEERSPLVAGRLNHDQLAPVGDQLVSQPQDLRCRRRPRRHRRLGLSRAPALNPDAHLRVALADVEPGQRCTTTSTTTTSSGPGRQPGDCHGNTVPVIVPTRLSCRARSSEVARLRWTRCPRDRQLARP